MFKPEHRCENCRYWDAHSTDLRKGDCRAPGDHRYSRVETTNVDFRTGKETPFIALLDSFGPEETDPNFTCGAWRQGQADGLLVVDS